MNEPEPSPRPWTYDRRENIMRAADGTEVFGFPSAKAYPIDDANAELILRAVNKDFHQQQGDPNND